MGNCSQSDHQLQQQLLYDAEEWEKFHKVCFTRHNLAIWNSLVRFGRLSPSQQPRTHSVWVGTELGTYC